MRETSPPAAPRRRVEVVDYLRFVAALSVVAFHYLYNGIKNGKVQGITHEPVIALAQYGYLGVNLFFMISGFVITQSVRGKTARQFAVGRALRLYPAFWIAVLITSGFALVLGGERMGVDPYQVLVNLTMIPTLLGQPFVDGVYWTLLYELSFYAAVFLLVLLRQNDRVAALMPGWAIVMGVVSQLDPHLAANTPFLGGYFGYFAAGAVIAAIADSGWSLYRAAGLVAAYVTVLPYHDPVLSALTTVLFAVMLVTLVPAVRGWRLPGSATAGALTYPLYLVHAHIGYMLLTRFATEENKWIVYPVTVAFVLSLAYLLHVTVEKNPRTRRFWKRLLDGTVGALTGLVQSAIDLVLSRIPGGRVDDSRPADGATVTR
ncbi:acyltransferase family protein [Brachybacterium sacelli]|uniref:Peptidoglycan/LPS O-acetylase OafA/YrhL n=1 Tax=Brachybacterium sacelli TaxID=173364 RepID=A0ABS4X578_9MICO|nr:acyltransferase [Brachybacterium sacelli]MBP2383597.1 peptidoglycan/LPS O-acetylase OafA/YrhL [Brachybacterium sacelli]